MYSSHSGKAEEGIITLASLCNSGCRDLMFLSQWVAKHPPWLTEDHMKFNNDSTNNFSLLSGKIKYSYVCSNFSVDMMVTTLRILSWDIIWLNLADKVWHMASHCSHDIWLSDKSIIWQISVWRMTSLQNQLYREMFHLIQPDTTWTST